MLPCRLSACRLPSRRSPYVVRHSLRRLTTLAIESSCDDTAVAVLSRSRTDGPARLLFNERISSDNREFKGVNPVIAADGHSSSLSKLVQRAIGSLPRPATSGPQVKLCYAEDGSPRTGPDFVSVTRGPGMAPNLAIGLNTAKGLAVAWGVPLVGVHHMQAHALTPQLVNALGTDKDTEKTGAKTAGDHPEFPFLSILVSGGHTQLVHSVDLTTHRIIATTRDMAIGNMLDQTARVILPPEILESSNDVMYGRVLESFAFPDSSPADYSFFKAAASRGEEMQAPETGYAWTLPIPFRQSRELAFSFSSMYTVVHRIAAANPAMPTDERRALARHTMAAAFQHLVGRVCIAIESDPDIRAAAKTVVVAGGVASNRFLMHVLRETLRLRMGTEDVEFLAPPVELCTDNAAMIAWTGLRMFEAGYYTDLSAAPIAKWPMDPRHGPGLLGVSGWLRREKL